MLVAPNRFEVAGLAAPKSDDPGSEVAGCCCVAPNKIGVGFVPPRFEKMDGCLAGCDVLLVPKILIEGTEDEDCGCEVLKSELVDPAWHCAEVAGFPKREEVAVDG